MGVDHGASPSWWNRQQRRTPGSGRQRSASATGVLEGSPASRYIDNLPDSADSLAPDTIVAPVSMSRPDWQVSVCAAVLSLGLLSGAAALAAAAAALHQNRPTGSQRVQRLVIETGTSARAIGGMLEREGIIRSADLFVALVRLQGLGNRLAAGAYELDGTRPTTAVIQTLLKAPLPALRVTVPEGVTRFETASLWARAAGIDSARFVWLTAAPDFVRSLGVDGPDLEGFLLPDTYFVEQPTSEEAVIRRMVTEFQRALNDSAASRLEQLGLSLRQAVILASIVEREAKVEGERPLIAGVFLRRLQLDQRLESCATVAHALGVQKARLTSADLQVDSPYNTYLHPGLPPGPIGNPGRASLLAVLYPARTDYLYFVARGDGTHIFSRTYAAHEAAKQAVRRER